MILVYSVMDRNLIFAKDSTYTHAANNAKIIYKYGKWEEYGYLDYVPYADYLQGLKDNGEIDEDTRAQAVSIARQADGDSDLVKEYVKKFQEQNGSYLCRELKGVETGKVLRSCPDCIRDAVALTEEYLAAQK